MLFSNLNLVGFFLSYFLNRSTNSNQRTTVLSRKELFRNRGYGGIWQLYSLLLALLRRGYENQTGSLGENALKNQGLVDSLPWFGWFLLLALMSLLVFFARTLHL